MFHLTSFLTIVYSLLPTMTGIEIFGVVAGVIGFVPLIREVHNALIMVCDHCQPLCPDWNNLLARWER